MTAIIGLGADFPVGLGLDERNQSLADNFVIISNQDA